MVNPVFAASGISVFEIMSRLAAETGAINLGQGFPEGLEPQELIAAATDALHNGSHQYPPMLGLPALRKAVADNARRFFNIDPDWETEILVTSGATEALADSFFALMNSGDEVIVLEPAYDSYSPVIRRAGGMVVPVRLAPPHWELPLQALSDAITPRTRMIVVNNPMNPIGKVFTREELNFIAELAVKHNLFIIADEVYEHLTFDDNKHISLFSLPEIRDRVVRIGSAGKSFSLTGWKVGYIIADAQLLKVISRVHQYMTFTTPPALQAAVAVGLNLPDSYFTGLREELAKRRDYLDAGLREAGFNIASAPATYFAVADISDLDKDGDDLAFSQRLTREAGVTPVPVSSFYSERNITSHVRFCFAKKLDTLETAINRLRDWREKQS
ncbi:aminotransferase [Pseudochrobactrum saccharolyticum]|uniref:Aspartate/methionine/tyrosine aminotransferase n=1 Tax=Pseudochrobactrum saccharolyticum TaxID=354352 RepID=A0A7W8EQ89_9HYPH|nr:aminotransferase [Pseudochrobactrum saccharolyticum]KAB0537378.1 aminotransferase [Pseudochrobactrum saccharolyticum]MBB5092129.1 aspartate/methionine/tyrosine aminotransferase [Pseudochrobactrum saccharolyticum]MDP8252525.1 aminotransferase [Pseudochrobactrum saccharolyticum]